MQENQEVSNNVTEIAKAQSVEKSGFDAFLSRHADKITSVLSRNIDKTQYLAQIVSEARRNPNLLECTRPSLISTIAACAQLNLSLGSLLGHAWIIPYRNNQKGITEAQFQIGYKGWIELGRRSGKVRTISAQVVYENDLFEFEYGSTPYLRHVPAKSNPGEIIAFYAIVHLDDGSPQFEVMWRHQVDAHYKKYAPKNPIWAKNYEEMAKKTVIKKLFKLLPISTEIARAVTLDDYAEVGEQQSIIEPIECTDFDVETGEVKQSKTEKLSQKLGD